MAQALRPGAKSPTLLCATGRKLEQSLLIGLAAAQGRPACSCFSLAHGESTVTAACVMRVKTACTVCISARRRFCRHVAGTQRYEYTAASATGLALSLERPVFGTNDTDKALWDSGCFQYSVHPTLPAASTWAGILRTTLAPLPRRCAICRLHTAYHCCTRYAQSITTFVMSAGACRAELVRLYHLQLRSGPPPGAVRAQGSRRQRQRLYSCGRSR